MRGHGAGCGAGTGAEELQEQRACVERCDVQPPARSFERSSARKLAACFGMGAGVRLVAGSVSGGLLERNHRQEVARIAAERRAAEQLRQVRQQQAAMVSTRYCWLMWTAMFQAGSERDGAAGSDDG